MKEYLLLFRGGDAMKGMSAEEMQVHMQQWMQWMGELNAKGKFSGAQPLINTGKVITGTKKVVSDGPFMEGKEMVGGYLILKAGNYDEEVQLSNDCPVLAFVDGTVEVREIQELQM
jgi:hypothetical protein